MPYEAIVCRISTRPHPDPKVERIQLATAAGYSCIVSLDCRDGDLGVVFPEGGQLAHEFCLANSLYRKNPETGEPMGGYLEPNRRIKAVKLRGVESEALWLPLHAVSKWLASMESTRLGPHLWDTVAAVADLREGHTLTEVNGVKLCGKYYTPETLRAMFESSRSPAVRQASRQAQALEKHYDTPQLRSAQLPPGDVWITEKIHGTSGRTGYVQVEQPLAWWARALNWCGFRFKPKKVWEYVSGTRNCIVDSNAGGEKGKGYRVMAHDLISPWLRQGEVWYYELSGFEETGKPIMAPHHIGQIGDAKLEKRLRRAVQGEDLVYHYGCAPDGRMPGCILRRWQHDLPPRVRFKIHVYRITQDGVDLPMAEIIERVIQVVGLSPPGVDEFLGVVPVLAYHRAGSWIEGELRTECDALTRGASELGLPIREGVCVRVESRDGGGLAGDTQVGASKVRVHTALKHKGFVFCALEGIKKNDPTYLDAEEIA